MHMKVSRLHRNIAGAAVSFVGLFGFLLFTQPSEDNFGISFAPLILLWALLYFVSGLVLVAAFRHTRHIMVQVLRVAIASSVTLLVMFQALGDVSILDGFVLLALGALGSFYFSRTWRS